MIQSANKGQRAVAIWIYTGVGMLLIQVILGGITRLTGSGLSITEWNLVTGALPPLSQQQWLDEFAKYRETPQYQLLNTGFTIADFKFIFFWEWFHRNWARLISVVFVVGFVYLLAKKYMQAAMIRPLLILFLLGALQGAIGWIMVASGLTGDAVYVKPTRLALHFVFALGLICYAWWFALQLSVPKTAFVRNPALRRWTWGIIALLFVQLVYGALMAGHKAATAAPTWPTINGYWIPGGLFARGIDLVENRITIHFIHRGMAYLLLAATLGWLLAALRTLRASGSLFARAIWAPPALVVLQVLLGIAAVLTSSSIVPNHWVAFDWLALLHQVVGMGYLLTMVLMLYLVRSVR